MGSQGAGRLADASLGGGARPGSAKRIRAGGRPPLHTLTEIPRPGGFWHPVFGTGFFALVFCPWGAAGKPPTARGRRFRSPRVTACRAPAKPSHPSPPAGSHSVTGPDRSGAGHARPGTSPSGKSSRSRPPRSPPEPPRFPAAAAVDPRAAAVGAAMPDRGGRISRHPCSSPPCHPAVEPPHRGLLPRWSPCWWRS